MLSNIVCQSLDDTPCDNYIILTDELIEILDTIRSVVYPPITHGSCRRGNPYIVLAVQELPPLVESIKRGLNLLYALIDTSGTIIIVTDNCINLCILINRQLNILYHYCDVIPDGNAAIGIFDFFEKKFTDKLNEVDPEEEHFEYSAAYDP